MTHLQFMIPALYLNESDVREDYPKYKRYSCMGQPSSSLSPCPISSLGKQLVHGEENETGVNT